LHACLRLTRTTRHSSPSSSIALVRGCACTLLAGETTNEVVASHVATEISSRRLRA
jgi:hypothetical protein